jgi:hypothetical protein
MSFAWLKNHKKKAPKSSTRLSVGFKAPTGNTVDPGEEIDSREFSGDHNQIFGRCGVITGMPTPGIESGIPDATNTAIDFRLVDQSGQERQKAQIPGKPTRSPIEPMCSEAAANGNHEADTDLEETFSLWGNPITR